MLVRTLLVDNYDSYTFNLFQMLTEINGTAPQVIRNDELSWPEFREVADGFTNVVVSPGPGHPANARDFGVCREVFTCCRLPILGVCLGHQGLAYCAGASVVRAPEPMHGRLSKIEHADDDLFAGIPQQCAVVRYHSLIVRKPLPPVLKMLAWTADGLIMAVRHVRKPQWGVQFHPESIASSHGERLLGNFRDITVGLTNSPLLVSTSGEGLNGCPP
jgi:anthranilate synthase/aminodeoxychorismate synthase-like glutamine amidotransferase